MKFKHKLNLPKINFKKVKKEIIIFSGFLVFALILIIPFKLLTNIENKEGTHSIPKEKMYNYTNVYADDYIHPEWKERNLPKKDIKIRRKICYYLCSEKYKDSKSVCQLFISMNEHTKRITDLEQRVSGYDNIKGEIINFRVKPKQIVMLINNGDTNWGSTEWALWVNGCLKQAALGKTASSGYAPKCDLMK